MDLFVHFRKTKPEHIMQAYIGQGSITVCALREGSKREVFVLSVGASCLTSSRGVRLKAGHDLGVHLRTQHQWWRTS